MITSTNQNLPLWAAAVDAEKITKIYSGKDKVCRCGCKGTYAEKGTKAFNLRLKKFLAEFSKPTADQEVGDNYINVSLENDRALTVYFD